MVEKELSDYLKLIDSRAPGNEIYDVEVAGMTLRINPYVWDPTRGKSSKMFLRVLAEYPLVDDERILDVGTGSGVLALVLWKRGAKHIQAVDNMEEAVKTARYNFERNGADIETRSSDLFSNVSGRYGLIVFNAPATHPLRRDVPRTMQSLWSPEDNLQLRYAKGLEEHLVVCGKALLMYSRFPDFDPIPEATLRALGISFAYLERDTSGLTESGVIELRR